MLFTGSRRCLVPALSGLGAQAGVAHPQGVTFPNTKGCRLGPRLGNASAGGAWDRRGCSRSPLPVREPSEEAQLRVSGSLCAFGVLSLAFKVLLHLSPHSPLPKLHPLHPASLPRQQSPGGGGRVDPSGSQQTPSPTSQPPASLTPSRRSCASFLLAVKAGKPNAPLSNQIWMENLGSLVED